MLFFWTFYKNAKQNKLCFEFNINKKKIEQQIGILEYFCSNDAENSALITEIHYILQYSNRKCF